MHTTVISDQPANVLNATNLVVGFTVMRIGRGATAASATPSQGPVESCPTLPDRGTNNHEVIAVGVGVPLLATLIGILVLLRKETRANALIRVRMAEGCSQPYIGQAPEKDVVSQPTELETVSRLRELDSRAKNTR